MSPAGTSARAWSPARAVVGPVPAR